jgi:hypothetical protein
MICFSVLLTCQLHAQQVGDASFIPKNTKKTFEGPDAPVVLIDEAHHNFHTLDGRYQAFAKVLRSDGYSVRSNTSPFHIDSLKKADILVISNALNEKNVENWDMPHYPAFTREEIEHVYRWVKQGGALFLIADHMPLPAAASQLAAIFGVQFNNGYAIDTTNTRVTMFRRSDGSLTDHPITRGRNEAEAIDSVRTFTGQAFLATPQASPLLIFREPTLSVMPSKSWTFDEDTPHIPVDGWFQGAVLAVGEGRIAVFGEAAMFTAQSAGQDNVKFGLEGEGAEQNEQFLLNIMHWLSKII